MLRDWQMTRAWLSTALLFFASPDRELVRRERLRGLHRADHEAALAEADHGISGEGFTAAGALGVG
ncbi:MAG: hypothetical protein KA152_18970 [Verrucomicrobiales bacterium]|nr:hypothetical protein [Verrucomicrobiales bacterium]